MRDFLHRVTKIFLILLLITALITAAVVGWVYFSNQSKLKDEAGLIATPPGQMVEVDGHKIHVYVTGDENAEDTIVFLHGTGMADASVAMQPLFDKLVDRFRIVYVDRPGNGYSEAGCGDKSVDNITEETREALAGAGIEGKFTLFAQTTSGIEAFYWAEKYPEEVSAIIGLDMSTPEEYASYQSEESGFRFMMYLFSSIGVIRHIDSAYPEDRYNLYSDKQILVRSALISRGSYTKDMYEEDKALGDNARIANEGGFLEDIPMLVMLSNPIIEPYLSTDAGAMADLKAAKKEHPEYDFEAAYNKARKEYFGQYDNVECAEMSGPSALYTYIPEEMSEKITDFLTNKK